MSSICNFCHRTQNQSLKRNQSIQTNEQKKFLPPVHQTYQYSLPSNQHRRMLERAKQLLERRINYKPPPPIRPKLKRDPCPERPIRKTNTWTRSTHRGSISPIQLPIFDDEFERYSPSSNSTIDQPTTTTTNTTTTIRLPPIKSHPKPWR